MWLPLIAWISLGVFFLMLLAIFILVSTGEEKLSFGEAVGGAFSIAMTVFLVVGLVPTGIGCFNTGKLDPETATYTAGTAEDLIGSKQSFRDCAPGDAKFTLVTGKENDVSFGLEDPHQTIVRY